MANETEHIMKLLDLAANEEQVLTILEDVLFIKQHGSEGQWVSIRRVVAYYAAQVGRRGKKP